MTRIDGTSPLQYTTLAFVTSYKLQEESVHFWNMETLNVSTQNTFGTPL